MKTNKEVLKKMGLKNVMVWTNPLTWIFGIPVLVGIVLGVAAHNLTRDTQRVIKSVAEDIE